MLVALELIFHQEQVQQPPQQPAAAATAVACEPLQQWALWQMLDSAFPTGTPSLM
jgi:hypothetical protein